MRLTISAAKPACTVLFSIPALACGFFIAACLGTFAVSASAATYYVATNGIDTNPGTISQPFATLQKAANLANPGDTIYMRGGTYTLAAQITISRNGSSGNYINVVNYPGEVPI